MIAFIENDTGPALQGEVHTSLEGAAVTLHFRKPNGTGVLTRTPTITDAPAGLFAYAWQTGDLTPTGVWSVEAQVTFGDGEIQTFGPQDFRVNPEIA